MKLDANLFIECVLPLRDPHRGFVEDPGLLG